MKKSARGRPGGKSVPAAKKKPAKKKAVKKKAVKKKAASTKAASTKAASTKAASTKAASKKSAAKKTASTKKRAAKKSATRKSAATKSAATKSATRKRAATKTGAAKSATKKRAATRSAAKKSATKKKRATKKSATTRSAATKSAATKSAAKKSAATKSAAKKSAAKKSATTKRAAKKSTAKNRAAKTRAATSTRRAPTSERVAGGSPLGRAVIEASADEALVERTMELLDAHEERVADSMREIGEHLFVSYFGGDEALARSRVPERPLSYERLARRAEAETSWDAADLRRAVTAALVHRSLPSGLAGRVPPSYLVRLDSVDDPSARASIAGRIAAGELRGRAAEEAITLASVSLRRGGRPRTPGPLRLANGLERLLERAQDFNGLDSTEVWSLDELERASLAGRIDDAARRLTAVAARIRFAR